MASQYEKFWDHVWEEYGAKINNEGFYRIKIKPDFERIKDRYNLKKDNRLLAKMDHSVDRPEIFKKEGLSLISGANNDYVISRANSYTKIPEIKGTKKTVKVNRTYELLDPFDFSTEKEAITIAYNLGIFEDFINDGPISLSVSGRFGHKPKLRGHGTFTASTAKNIAFEVGDSQMEVDASYETEKSVVIVEMNDANKGVPADFNTRQLYYPLIDFRSRGVKKAIRPIYMVVNRQVFTLFEYKVLDETDINSFQLDKKKEYILEK